MLPKTTRRVEVNTATEINRRITQQTEERIRFFAANPDQISQRLEELDEEWDIERTLETNASALALLGIALGAFVNKRFLALPALGRRLLAATRPTGLVFSRTILPAPRRENGD